ncbi:hypothetical protein D3C80_1417330 [compost metagenome]
MRFYKFLLEVIVLWFLLIIVMMDTMVNIVTSSLVPEFCLRMRQYVLIEAVVLEVITALAPVDTMEVTVRNLIASP